MYIMHINYHFDAVLVLHSSYQDRLARGRNGGADPVQMSPDRNLVLESRGLLEGQLEKVGAKFGSRGGCKSPH
jgi:hypothetical protein